MDATPQLPRRTLLPTMIVALACLAAGGFAVLLNGRFYSRNQPFYDSMSYHQQVHSVMQRARSEGLGTALHEACRSSTVCLPLALAAIAGPFCDPSRAVGIAIQVAELLFFAGTLLFYLRQVRGFDPWTAMLGITPFLAWHCLYDFNGGLSDFRMDLSLALLTSTTVLWYMIAMTTGRMAHFLVLGFAAAATCLFRATAPVYLVLMLAPLAIADLIPAATRRQRLRGLALAAASATLGAAWFFVLNYRELHFYYVVWNTDANAHLPLRTSISHARFAIQHVGTAAAIIALSFPIILGIESLLQRTRPASSPPPASIGPPRLDWRIAWVGIAPILLLVTRGAGLNPFVSMPAAFGLTLFLMLPLAGPLRHAPSQAAWFAIAAVAVPCILAAGIQGWRSHHGGSVDSMAAHRTALDAIVDDARRQGRDTASYATTHCYYLNRGSLHNVATFDHPDAVWVDAATRIRGVAMQPDAYIDIAAQADWDRLPGTTDDEKLAHLLATADRDIDYLAIPDEATTAFVAEHLPFNVINRHAVTLRQRLLGSGRWTPVSDPIRNGDHEVVTIYRNTHGTP
jgi:hypothetical protein